jgi:LEA14-like dessication related protein
VTVPSVPGVIQIVDVALRSYFLATASELKLTNPEEVQEAIRGLKVDKTLGPNSIHNRTLKHFPVRPVSRVDQIFKVVLRTHHFPSAWKQA